MRRESWFGKNVCVKCKGYGWSAKDTPCSRCQQTGTKNGDSFTDYISPDERIERLNYSKDHCYCIHRVEVNTKTCGIHELVWPCIHRTPIPKEVPNDELDRDKNQNK